MPLLLDQFGNAVSATSVRQGAFVTHREPDPRWTARLREVFPIEENRAYPELLWEAGEDVTIEHDGKPLWLGVQRWMIYEMAPPALAHLLGIAEELDGPFENHTLVSKRQWELWRSHGRYAVPVWVIQGSKGGHKLRFSQREVQMLGLAGNADVCPMLPGELPYADFDERVVAKLVEARRLADIQSRKRYSELREEEEKAFRVRLLQWLTDQINPEMAKEMGRAIDKLDVRSPLSTLHTDFSAELADAEEQFVETGEINQRRVLSA